MFRKIIGSLLQVAGAAGMVLGAYVSFNSIMDVGRLIFTTYSEYMVFIAVSIIVPFAIYKLGKHLRTSVGTTKYDGNVVKDGADVTQMLTLG